MSNKPQQKKPQAIKKDNGKAKQQPSTSFDKNCKLFPIGVPLLVVAIALSFLIFHLVRAPTPEEWQLLLEFIAFEVPPNLYLVFAPSVLLFALGYWKDLNRHVFYPLLSLASLGVFARFAIYYFGTAQMLEAIPPAWVQQFDVKICPPETTCSIWKDLSSIYHETDKGAQIWVDDAFWVTLLCVPLYLIESGRHNFRGTASIYLILNFILGFDVVLPLFFRTLEHAEQKNKKNLRNTRRYHWLYFILGVAATASWLPNLMDWVIAEGTVAGQLDAGCRLPAGARATWAIMLTSFTLGFHTVSQININAHVSVLSFIMTWLARLFMIVLICSNVAAALAVFLIFRELVAIPSFLQHQ